MHLQQIRCADIEPDPLSAGYCDEDVVALADSVRVFGVLRPIVVKQDRGGFVIVHGERRWRAACLVGLETIPATIVEPVTERFAPTARDRDRVSAL